MGKGINNYSKKNRDLILIFNINSLNFKAVFCGMMLGSPTWGKICDTFGRRICLFFCNVFTSTFGLFSSFSPSFIYMLVFRGLVGFGIGDAPQAVTLCSEFLP
jgi:MFS family permease